MYCVEAVPPGDDVDTDLRESAVTMRMRMNRACSKTSSRPRMFLYCDGCLFPEGGTVALRSCGLVGGVYISRLQGLSCLFLASRIRTWCAPYPEVLVLMMNFETVHAGIAKQSMSGITLVPDHNVTQIPAEQGA